MNKAEQLSQDFIHGQLDGSQKAVEVALIAIYERQTQEEKVGAYAIQTNGVGFSKFDAEFCTSLVQQLNRGRSLTPRQLEVARKKIKRYWRQLITCMTTEVPVPMVDNDRPTVAPMRRAPALPYVAPTVERASELYGSW